MAKVHRIRIVVDASPLKHLFALTRRIAHKGEGSFDTALSEKEFKRYRAYEYDFVPALRNVMQQLLQIEGVTHLDIRPYGIVVTISEAYDWSDVNPEILTILKDAFFEGETARLVEIQDRTIAS